MMCRIYSDIEHTEAKLSKAIRFYSRAELLRRLPYSPTTLWRQCKRGNFPKPEKISPGLNGWESEAADAAIAALVTNSKPENDDE